MRPQLLVFALFLLAMCQVQCAVDPADDDAENVRPTVAIVEGAMDSSTVDYRVDFRWRGVDDDGAVSGFETAIDDTAGEDSWQWTDELGGLFTFSATTESEDPADTLFHDWHRFFVRAVDDESARSDADSRYFNTTTIAPRTAIIEPLISSGLLRLPTWFDVFWEGEDLDATGPEKIPEFYEYKLVEYVFGDDPLQALLENENVLLDTLDVPDRTAWIRVTSDVTSLPVSDLRVPALYVFGVRAIDEADAVEPKLELGANAFTFETTDEPCSPFVTIMERGLGSHTFPVDGPVWSVEAPSNTPIRFAWIGDGSFCGLRPGKVKYCLDENDCVDWSDISGVVEPLVFPDNDDGKTHNFVLWMRDSRDDPRTERECWVEIKVVAMPMDKTVLIVDDASPPRAFAGTDEEHDAFRDRVFSCLGDYLGPDEEIDDIEFFDIYGDDDLRMNPGDVPLSLIGQYKLVVWNSYFFARTNSGLQRNEVRRKILSRYVYSGGRLYLFGSKPISGLADDNYNDSTGDGLCPDLPGVDRPAWDETSFIWKFLHIRDCIRSATSSRQRIDGWIGAEPVHPLYPDIDINTDVWDPNEIGSQGEVKGGITAFQCYKERSPSDSQPDPGLDTIYVAKTFEHMGQESPLDGTPVALRYQPTAADSAQGLLQGRVFLQMFDFIFVEEEVAAEAACRAVDWLMTGRDE